MRYVTSSSDRDPRNRSRRRPASRRQSRRFGRSLQTESLECRCLLASDFLGAPGDVPMAGPDGGGPPFDSSIAGFKWNDLDGDAIRSRNEPGLGGVTIYSDLNNNRRLDDFEPSTETAMDNPVGAVATGHYILLGLEPGIHTIREVVPDSAFQTFPGPIAIPADDGHENDPLPPRGDVEPHFLELVLAPGEGHTTEVSITIHESLFVQVNLDVRATDPDVQFVNHTGTVINGGSGQRSTFEVTIDGASDTHYFDIEFVSAEHGDIYGAIPVVLTPFTFDGAHRVMLDHGAAVHGINFGNHVIEGGSIHGRKWLDQNGNGRQDPREPGLPGVAIYADLDRDGRLDNHEPRTVTVEDIEETDFDETGLYWLDVAPGEYLIREVVPAGFVQTFPGPRPPHGGPDPNGDNVSETHPERLELTLEEGEFFVTEVAWTFHPVCIRPWDVDVVSTGDLPVENMSGVQLNGCGGDTSHFEIGIMGDGLAHDFELQFIDTLGGSVLGTIPVSINGHDAGGGAHFVVVRPGQSVDGIDFGNQPRGGESGSIHGRKWLDENGNGRQDPREPGLPGVTIYADLNRNARFDPHEPWTVTMEEIEETDFDEAGLYWLDVPPGEYLIREIVPEGFVQTFPAPRPPHGGHDPTGDEFSAVRPEVLELALGEGEIFLTEVTLTVHPFCIRPFDVDVVSTGDLPVENLSGVQLNGCGGDTSHFQIEITGDGRPHAFELQFIDTLGGSVMNTIPVFLNGADPGAGAHFVVVHPGQSVDRIDFGNRRHGGESGSIHGIKWLDRDGDGIRDDDEPGLPGVTIYADLNGNGRLEWFEPSAVTMHDNDETAFDDTGMYWLENLPPREYIIREVVPAGYEQSFPGLNARVVDSETGRYGSGVAIELDITDVTAQATENDEYDAQLEFTVVWPDSCGQLIGDLTTHTVVGDHILVELHGHQTGSVCAEVISPETHTVKIDGLAHERHQVVATLHEDVQDQSDIATLAVVGTIVVGGRAGHFVELHPNEVVDGIDFGNRPLPPAQVHGRKWLDENGNGAHDDGEPGLPGSTLR